MKHPYSSLSLCASRLLVWLLAAFTFGASLPQASKATGTDGSPSPRRNRTVSEHHAAYGQTPLHFEANRGQAQSVVKFIARGRGGALFFTATEAAAGPVRLQFAGANAQPRISGVGELPGKSHYFLGDNPRLWVTNAPLYAGIKYEAVYPGIDLLFYGGGSERQQLEYDFVIAPGANPRAIKLRFKGARRLGLAADGDLLIETGAGEVRQPKPFVYQETKGEKHEITGRYVIEGEQVRFDIARYDGGKPPVIDPMLSYSTFLGGQDADVAQAIAVDNEGNAYVTGSTTLSENFPFTFPMVPGAPPPTVTPPTKSGAFIFVTKLSADGSDVLYSVIIGGTRGIRDFQSTNYALDNRSRAIAVDAQGNVYVAGQTHSENFPTTAGTIQPFSLPSQFSNEAFVFKLNSKGTTLAYSTLLGRGAAEGNGVAVDGQGQAWVTGETSSRNFPVTPDAFQKTMKNTSSSIFVAKLNPTATQLLYATYLSSGSGEAGAGIAVDAGGNAYVGGTTSSSCSRNDAPPVEPFPTTEGAYRRDTGQGCVPSGENRLAFVTKFKADGTLGFSTLLGAGFGGRIAVDATGNAYVTGITTKGNGFPITPGALQSEIIGAPTTQAAFITKLNPQGSALVYSTYINGAAGEPYDGPSLAVGAGGNACIAGTVSANTFVRTTTENPFLATGGVFVAKIDPAGGAFIYSVVIGEGLGRGIAADAHGNVFVTGETKSDKFPVTSNAFQQRLGNLPGAGTDAFVSKISDASVTRPISNVSAASYAGSAFASDSIIAAFGSKLATATQIATSNPLPIKLADTSAKVKDSDGVERAAALFFVSPTQVNYLLPSGTASGAATVTITSGGGTALPGSFLFDVTTAEDQSRFEEPR